MKRLVLVLALTGCPDPEPPTAALIQLTYAPPASQADVVDHDTGGGEITLSVGVAMAVWCWDDCGPDATCKIAKLTTSDVNVLGIRPLYRVNAGDRREFVLVGSTIGNATLHVETDCAATDYDVTVPPRGP